MDNNNYSVDVNQQQPESQFTPSQFPNLPPNYYRPPVVKQQVKGWKIALWIIIGVPLALLTVIVVTATIFSISEMGRMHKQYDEQHPAPTYIEPSPDHTPPPQRHYRGNP